MPLAVGLGMSATVLASISEGKSMADALALRSRCSVRIREMKTIDAVGYLAASLVLAAFCMKSMNALHLAAIASNVAFIAYGYLEHLTPVLLPHALLLPINVHRLVNPQ